MADDITITRRLDDIARKLEEIAGIDPGALIEDTEITARLARIANAITGGVLEAHSTGAHTDVSISTPVAGNILEWDGVNWVNKFQALGTHGDVTLGALAAGEYLRTDGINWLNSAILLSDLPAIAYNDLSDVDASSPSSPGEVVKWTGVTWQHGQLLPAELGNVFFVPGIADSLVITDSSILQNTIGWGASDIIQRNGTVPLTANWDAGSFDIEARAFEVKATSNHRIDDDGADNLVIENTNDDESIFLGVNRAGVGSFADLVEIRGAGPNIVIDPATAVASLNGDGIIDVKGTWATGASVFAVMNFQPTFTGGSPLGFYIRPEFDYADVRGELIRINSSVTTGNSINPSIGLTGLLMEHSNVDLGQNQLVTAIKDRYTRSMGTGAGGNWTFKGAEFGGTMLNQSTGGNLTEISLDINGGAFNFGTGTITQYGLKLTNFGSSAGTVTQYALHSNGGTFAWAADNAHIRIGGGEDVAMYYDGTDFYVVTDRVTASDFILDCGPQKTLELAETVWDDVPASAVRLGGTSPANEQAYKGGLVISFVNTSDSYVYFVIQLPHRYKEGTDIKLHIHWTIPTSGAGLGAENVKWDLTYSASTPVTGSWPAASTGTVTVDVQNDTLDDHLVDTVATISGASFGISEVIICSLKRDTTVANNYADDAYVVSIDAHYEVDTMGSRQEFTK